MAEKRYFLAGQLIDGSDREVRRKVYLRIEEGIITAIGPAADLPPEAKGYTDDFYHCTISPPLFDCSVSLSHSPSVLENVPLNSADYNLSQETTMLARHISDNQAHGVLGVADGNDNDNLVKRYQKEIKQKGLLAIRRSGPICQNMEDYRTCNTKDCDFIKITYSPGIDVEEPTSSRLEYAELCSIIKHRDYKKTVVIANGNKQVGEALDAGCDAIEQGYSMGEDNLKRMAEKDIMWIPNVLRAKNGLDGASGGGSVCCRFSQRYIAPGKVAPGAKTFWEKILTEQLEQLRLGKTLGVRTATGTGAGNVGLLHGESMVEEIKLFIKAGYSLEEAISCATKNGAEFFGIEKQGTLAVGQKATFLITRGTAKQLPRKLSYLEGLYIDGKPGHPCSSHPLGQTSS